MKTYLFLLSLLALISCTGRHHSGESVLPINPTNPLNPNGLGPAPINLSITAGPMPSIGDMASAGSYILLAKAAISDTSGSIVFGNVGLSPAAESYITNFPLVRDASNEFSTSNNVTGSLYAADLSSPTPANLTSAISNMEAAYTDAAGRTSPDHTELAAGLLGGLTLSPGLYKWGGNVLIPTALTFSGGANDIWILQVAGTLDLSSGIHVILGGQAQAKNIYWQVAQQVTIGTNAHFEGVILGKTAIVLETGCSLHGRALSQTAITLDSSTVTQL